MKSMFAIALILLISPMHASAQDAPEQLPPRIKQQVIKTLRSNPAVLGALALAAKEAGVIGKPSCTPLNIEAANQRALAHSIIEFKARAICSWRVSDKDAEKLGFRLGADVIVDIRGNFSFGEKANVPSAVQVDQILFFRAG